MSMLFKCEFLTFKKLWTLNRTSVLIIKVDDKTHMQQRFDEKEKESSMKTQ